MEFIRPKKVRLSLDMAPLIDIVFQLLIFFMLTSTFLNPAIQLNLPKAVQADPRQMEKIVVSVDGKGAVFVNTQPVSLDSLQANLTSRLVQEPRKAVHIRGDQEMPYKTFIKIIDISRQAGAEQINLIHESD